MFIWPEPFERGQNTVVIAPSLPWALRYPNRMERGMLTARSLLGPNVYTAKHVASDNGYTSGDINTRGDEIQSLLENIETRLILTTIGGYNSNQILDKLDLPKLSDVKSIVGYSDTTSLLCAMTMKNFWVTFYGPAILPQFGEYPHMDLFTSRCLIEMLTTRNKHYEFPYPSSYTYEYSDWSSANADVNTRGKHTYLGPRIIRKGTGNGTLFGGNIETLNVLIGTKWWSQIDRVILFIEAVDEEAFLPRFERALTQLKHIGLIDRIAALLVGYDFCYSSYEGITLSDVLIRVVGDHQIPIVANLPFGHGDPMWTIPIGAQCHVHATDSECRVIATMGAGSQT